MSSSLGITSEKKATATGNRNEFSLFFFFSFIYATMITFPRGSTQHPSSMYFPYKVRGKQTNNPSTIGIGNQFPHGIFGGSMLLCVMMHKFECIQCERWASSCSSWRLPSICSRSFELLDDMFRSADVCQLLFTRQLFHLSIPKQNVSQSVFNDHELTERP